MQPAADDAVTEGIFVPAVDGCIGRCGDRIDRVEWHDRMTRAIVRDTEVVDDRVWRQLPDTRFEVGHGETCEVMERHTPRERRPLQSEEVGV